MPICPAKRNKIVPWADGMDENYAYWVRLNYTVIYIIHHVSHIYIYIYIMYKENIIMFVHTYLNIYIYINDANRYIWAKTSKVHAQTSHGKRYGELLKAIPWFDGEVDRCFLCFFRMITFIVELREWGVFRFGNPTSGGTVFLHVQNWFPCFPLLMNFVSHCVSLASTCWRGQKHGPRVKAEHCRPTRTELTETEMISLVKHLIKKVFCLWNVISRHLQR